MPPKSKANDASPAPLPTYVSPPSKSNCPQCKVELYFYPLTAIDNVKDSLLYSCASCHHCFTPVAPDNSATDGMSKLSISVTHYDILGVDNSASAEEIARAYRKKSLQCHPDRTKGREKEWEDLARAYEILGDKRKRHWYDMELEKGSATLDSSEDPQMPRSYPVILEAYTL